LEINGVHIMDNRNLNQTFKELSTPLIADACVRLGLALRAASSGIKPVSDKGGHVAGRVLPVQHHGSVDVFLEAMTDVQKGDVLVIDNGGRKDEGCIGDLTVLEVQACGLAAIVLWGCHRDTSELKNIRFPVFSYGSYPVGPTRLDPRPADALDFALFGNFRVTKTDIIFADDDGVIFVPDENADEVISIARTILETERRQAKDIKSGNKLRDQLRFEKYLRKRRSDPSYTFRRHLREIGGAIEE
jgi:4-hydroxy-4-methyl-2-oxoglutarate aldolase